MASRRPANGGLQLSKRQLDAIAKLRGQEPPMAWNKIVVELELNISGERLRTLCRNAGMVTSDGRTQHLGGSLPWKTVLDHHRNSAVYRMLKRHSYATQGRPLSASDQVYLDDWRRWMDGANEWGIPLAVHYDRQEGWSIRRREKGDDGPISPPPQLQVIQ